MAYVSKDILNNDSSWLNYLYGGDGKYVQSLFDPVQTHALYGIYGKDELERCKALLSKNPAINRFKVVSNSYGYKILCFKYNAAKDNKRKSQLDEIAAKEASKKADFAAAIETADTTRYSVSEKDLAKMNAYKNKGSNPTRLVKSIKDSKKLVTRWLAALMINWDEAAAEFVGEIESRKVLTKAEIVAYTNKYTLKQAEEMKELAENLTLTTITIIDLKDFILERIN